MGLFGKKKDKKKQAKQALITISPWVTKPVTDTYRLPSEHESTIYTYNGEPFNGMPTDKRFIIAAVPADVSMVSPYTGTQASTTTYGDIAYEYNGQIFGFCSAHAEAIRNMMLAGYRVELEAYICKYNMEYGYPMIRGLFGFVDNDVYSSIQR